MRTLERSMVTLQSKSSRSWPLLMNLMLAFIGRGRIKSLKDALSCFALANQALESSRRENSNAHCDRFYDRETPADASTRALKKQNKHNGRENPPRGQLNILTPHLPIFHAQERRGAPALCCLIICNGGCYGVTHARDAAQLRLTTPARLWHYMLLCWMLPVVGPVVGRRVLLWAKVCCRVRSAIRKAVLHLRRTEHFRGVFKNGRVDGALLLNALSPYCAMPNRLRQLSRVEVASLVRNHLEETVG